MILFNVFDEDMQLKGVCFARDENEAISIVSMWHNTGRVENWSAVTL